LHWSCLPWFTGTDVAKDAADVVLLEKDLKILGTGMVTGRIIYGNTIKWVQPVISKPVCMWTVLLPVHCFASCYTIPLHTHSHLDQWWLGWQFWQMTSLVPLLTSRICKYYDWLCAQLCNWLALHCRYIKFSASSSFGNTFSILAAAVWLPFTPIAPIQVLLLNLLYNISQVAIPWWGYHVLSYGLQPNIVAQKVNACCYNTVQRPTLSVLFKFHDNCPLFSKRKQLIGTQPIATSRSGLQVDVGLMAKLTGLLQGHHGSRVLEAAQEMECQIPGSLHVSWTKHYDSAVVAFFKIGGMSAGCRICSVCCYQPLLQPYQVVGMILQAHNWTHQLHLWHLYVLSSVVLLPCWQCWRFCCCCLSDRLVPWELDDSGMDDHVQHSGWPWWLPVVAGLVLFGVSLVCIICVASWRVCTRGNCLGLYECEHAYSSNSALKWFQ